MPKISDFNLGEYDARQEYSRGEQYFLESYISPTSFPLSTLNNRQNYIIVGKKGAGKTAAQLFLESTKTAEGYLSHVLSFFDDVTPRDYVDFAKTQKISILEIGKVDNIALLYDFKEVWTRIVLIKLARLIADSGIKNAFTDFCLSSTKGKNSLTDGLKKSLKVEISIPLPAFSAKLAFDPGQLVSSNELDLADFNKIGLSLLSSECKMLRIYFFIDELIISTLNTASDEYRARLALIRDIVRVCSNLNRFALAQKLDFHFICNLRPEVRNKLNEIDPELTKIMDGNDVLLTWDESDIIQILHEKVKHGAPAGSKIDLDGFFPKTVSFGTGPIPFDRFILNQSWHRPRDMIRFLKAYAKINPNDEAITEAGIKSSLNEYARISAVELFEELSVRYSQSAIEGIRRSITTRRFSDEEALSDALKANVTGVPIAQLMADLFDVGVIGNLDEASDGTPRNFWSYRGEESLDPKMPIAVHWGVVNYFNIRHR